MSQTWKRSLLFPLGTGANAQATLVYGPLFGQLTPQAALNEARKQFDSSYANPPKLGKVFQNNTGTV